MTGKLFKEDVLKVVERHVNKKNLLHSGQFGCSACHSSTLQCLRLMDDITLNFNNIVSTAVVFLDIKKAFDPTWHPGLLHKL
jgi:hypothetical protein